MKRAVAAFILGCAAFTCAALAEDPAPRPAPTSLTRPKSATQPVDARGFIHRWLVLEPVPVPGRLTESAVEEALQSAPLAAPMTALPGDGESVTLANNSVR